MKYKTDDMRRCSSSRTAGRVVVPESSPFKTFEDLVKAAKAKPETVTLAGSGTFSANHMAHRGA